MSVKNCVKPKKNSEKPPIFDYKFEIRYSNN